MSILLGNGDGTFQPAHVVAGRTVFVAVGDGKLTAHGWGNVSRVP